MKIAFIIASTFIILGNSLVAQNSSLFSYERYENRNGDALNYRMLISDYDKQSSYPLVIFLHGSGERGNDNEAQLKWGVQEFTSSTILKAYKPIIIAAQCPEGERWANYNRSRNKTVHIAEPSEPMRLLRELIEEVIKNHNIDLQRIYITGLSMGGYGTYDALSRYPELFAAALPVCGGGDTSMASTYSDIPLWICHGALDDVVPVVHSIDMAAALREAGASPGLSIYPDTGHFSWLAAYSDPHIISWLFQQRRKSN